MRWSHRVAGWSVEEAFFSVLFYLSLRRCAKLLDLCTRVKFDLELECSPVKCPSCIRERSWVQMLIFAIFL